MRTTIACICSFLVGGAAGYGIATYILKKKFVNDHIDEMNAYDRNAVRPELKKDGETAKIEKEKDELLKTSEESNDDEDDSSSSTIESVSYSSHKVNTDNTDYTKFSEKKTKDEVPFKDAKKETKSVFDKGTRPKPYIITKRQFGEENLHYHKPTLMAIKNESGGYDLLTEDEEPYDIELVGPENLEQFGIPDASDSDVIYVRNEVESTDFEIILVER